MNALQQRRSTSLSAPEESDPLLPSTRGSQRVERAEQRGGLARREPCFVRKLTHSAAPATATELCCSAARCAGVASVASVDAADAPRAARVAAAELGCGSVGGCVALAAVEDGSPSDGIASGKESRSFCLIARRLKQKGMGSAAAILDGG